VIDMKCRCDPAEEREKDESKNPKDHQVPNR
jgi:hypothetical protein